MQLISRKSGKPVEVPEGEVQAAFQSGEYGLPSGVRLPMVGADGIGYVDAQNAQAAFEQGQRLASPQEVHKAQLEARYGGVGGAAIAGVAGAARGLTVGLSDPLAEGIAGMVGGQAAAQSTREALAGYQEANPIASGVGEVGGAVAPLLLSGGAAAPLEAAEGARAVGMLGRAAEAGSGAIRTAGALNRGIAGVGHAVEGGARALLGDGLLARVGSKTLAGAAEGALYGAGNEVSESTLGDTELTGEKLLAAMGHGALLGGATAGVLSSGGELATSVMGRLHPKLAGVAEEQAFRALSGRKAFTTEAAKIPGGERAIGRQLLDDGIISAGDSLDTLAPKVSAAREAAGKRIGDLLDTLDAANAEGPKVAEIHASIARDVLPDLEKLGETNKGAIGKVEGLMTDLANFARTSRGLSGEADVGGLRLTFREAQDFRTRLDDLIKWNTNPLAPVNETTVAMKGVRNAIENAVTDAGEAYANAAGKSFREEYQAAKLSYRRMALADKAAQDALERMHANAAHSLTDKIMGAHGMSAGLAHGLMSVGHAFAAGGIQGLALGFLASKASKLIRVHGNSTAAVMFDRMAALGGVERAARGVDRQIERGIAGVLSPGERVEAKLKVPVKGDYEKRVAQVEDAMRDAEGHVGAVAAAVSPVAAHAPQVANSFQRTALRATTFLASKVPPGHRNPTSLTPQLDRPRVTDAEKAAFLRYANAVHDPPSVLHHMAQGSVTKEEVEALRVVYPSLYNDVRARIGARLGEAKKPLPGDREAHLRKLFGLPTADPRLVKRMQQNFSPAAAAQAPGNGPRQQSGPKRPLEHAAQATSLAGLAPATNKG